MVFERRMDLDPLATAGLMLGSAPMALFVGGFALFMIELHIRNERRFSDGRLRGLGIFKIGSVILILSGALAFLLLVLRR